MHQYLTTYNNIGAIFLQNKRFYFWCFKYILLITLLSPKQDFLEYFCIKVLEL